MNITFLGQGYEPESPNAAGNHLINLLSQKDFDSFTGISAFASEAGVVGLANHIENAKKNFKRLNLIVGIDEYGTSKEALYAINNLKINSYIFYQAESLIFHPKIYLFEGKKKFSLILGSSNLTARGLFSNVESSLLVEFLNTDADGQRLLAELKKYYGGLFNFSDQNLFKISDEIIQKFIEMGIVANETLRNVWHSKIQKKTEDKSNFKIHRRPSAKIPREFRATKKTPALKRISISNGSVSKVIPTGKLVWTRKKLPSSSVQEAGTGTNPTGGLRLVQDDFISKGQRIDQTTYFRNEIFGDYEWRKIKDKPFVEVTDVPFIVTINGQIAGMESLEVRHKPSGEASQGNYTTSISWGGLGEKIRKAQLTGKKLDMYAPDDKSQPFQIVIG